MSEEAAALPKPELPSGGKLPGAVVLSGKDHPKDKSKADSSSAQDMTETNRDSTSTKPSDHGH